LHPKDGTVSGSIAVLHQAAIHVHKKMILGAVPLHWIYIFYPSFWDGRFLVRGINMYNTMDPIP